jgi:hypothetical protein
MPDWLRSLTASLGLTLKAECWPLDVSVPAGDWVLAEELFRLIRSAKVYAVLVGGVDRAVKESQAKWVEILAVLAAEADEPLKPSHEGCGRGAVRVRQGRQIR